MSTGMVRTIAEASITTIIITTVIAVIGMTTIDLSLSAADA